MIKNIIKRVSAVLAIILLIANVAMAADGDKSTVTLKSGEVVKGRIIEAVPNQYIKIELADKTIRRISADDILSMKTDEEQKHEDRKLGFSLLAGVYAGYDFTSGINYIMVEPRIVPGIRVGIHRIGFGIEFLYGHSQTYTDPTASGYGYYGNSVSSTSRQNLLYLPLVLNYHADFLKGKIKPSVDASAGYPCNLQSNLTYYSTPNLSLGGGYTDYYQLKQIGFASVEVSPGVSFKLAKHFMLNIAATLNLLAFQEVNQITTQVNGLSANSSLNDGVQNLSKTTRTAFSGGGSLTFIY